MNFIQGMIIDVPLILINLDTNNVSLNFQSVTVINFFQTEMAKSLLKVYIDVIVQWIIMSRRNKI